MPGQHLDVTPMSVDEAAALLRVSRDTIVRFTDNRYTPAGQQLRAEKAIGGEWRIHRADLAAFLTSRCVTPPDEEPITVPAAGMPHLHSLDEVATETGLPLWWLQKQASAGGIPHIKAGRAIRMTSGQADRAVTIRRAADGSRTSCGRAAA
jgi:excisionase family DNA binding protein